MIGLAIDSVTASVALWESCERTPCRLVDWRPPVPDEGNRADQLITTVDRLVRDHLGDYGAIELIAVTHGPGAFTAIRCGVAGARALALALDRPVLAVSTLEALAVAASPQNDGTVVTALDARRGQVYAQAFDHQLTALSPPLVTAPDAAVGEGLSPPIRLIGSGAALIRAAAGADLACLDPAIDPDARAVARRAADRLAAGERPVAGFELRPLYLRAPDARPQTPPFQPGRAVGA